MAFDTYTELKGEITGWMHRPNLAAQVPSFIRLAEAAINRKLRIGPMEIDVPLLMTPGQRLVARPTDMAQPIGLWRAGEKLNATLADSMDPNTTMAGAPLYWALDGSNLAFDKLADQAYPITFRYVQDTRLSDANPTNELLRRAPDLYLYGALAQAAPYMRDDERIVLWKSEFARLLKDVHTEYGRQRAVVPLRTDLPCSLLNR